MAAAGNSALGRLAVLHDVLHWGEEPLGEAPTAMSERVHVRTMPRKARVFRVTPRDRAIVRWVGRLRMATAAQVADRFDLGRAVSYSRLSGLVRLGLLKHARIFHGEPGVYLATRTGLRSIDLELPPARVDLRTYSHDLYVSSLVIELEREFGGERVHTEREMRAADTAVGAARTLRPRFAVPVAGADGRPQSTPVGHPRLHFPDCAVFGAAHEVHGSRRLLAVELERTAKGRTRLRRILASYVAARHIGGVRYYVVGDDVRRLLESELEAQRMHSLVELRVRHEAVRPSIEVDRRLKQSRGS